MIKVLERVVNGHVTKIGDPFIHSLKFANMTSKGVDGANIFILDTIHKHVESPKLIRLLLCI